MPQVTRTSRRYALCFVPMNLDSDRTIFITFIIHHQPGKSLTPRQSVCSFLGFDIHNSPAEALFTFQSRTPGSMQRMKHLTGHTGTIHVVSQLQVDDHPRGARN